MVGRGRFSVEYAASKQQITVLLLTSINGWGIRPCKQNILEFKHWKIKKAFNCENNVRLCTSDVLPHAACLLTQSLGVPPAAQGSWISSSPLRTCWFFYNFRTAYRFNGLKCERDPRNLWSAHICMTRPENVKFDFFWYMKPRLRLGQLDFRK